jgi:hypothetical protein
MHSCEGGGRAGHGVVSGLGGLLHLGSGLGTAPQQRELVGTVLCLVAAIFGWAGLQQWLRSAAPATDLENPLLEKDRSTQQEGTPVGCAVWGGCTAARGAPRWLARADSLAPREALMDGAQVTRASPGMPEVCYTRVRCVPAPGSARRTTTAAAAATTTTMTTTTKTTMTTPTAAAVTTPCLWRCLRRHRRRRHRRPAPSNSGKKPSLRRRRQRGWGVCGGGGAEAVPGREGWSEGIRRRRRGASAPATTAAAAAAVGRRLHSSAAEGAAAARIGCGRPMPTLPPSPPPPRPPPPPPPSLPWLDVHRLLRAHRHQHHHHHHTRHLTVTATCFVRKRFTCMLWCGCREPAAYPVGAGAGGLAAAAMQLRRAYRACVRDTPLALPCSSACPLAPAGVPVPPAAINSDSSAPSARAHGPIGASQCWPVAVGSYFAHLMCTPARL